MGGAEPPGIDVGDDMTRPHILFVTGRLAERPLRRMVESLAAEAGFVPEVVEVGVSVAALLQVDLLKRRLNVPAHIDRVQIIFSDFHHLNRPQPRSGLDGKQSVQYTTAVALLVGPLLLKRMRAPGEADE